MRRDCFHYYPCPVEKVFEAYAKALSNPPFKKVPTLQKYSLITFGIGFSFKFNMNGARVFVHFMPQGQGTAIQVRFTIVQIALARYQAYDDLMTQHVEQILGIKSKPMDGSAFVGGQLDNMPGDGDEVPEPMPLPQGETPEPMPLPQGEVPEPLPLPESNQPNPAPAPAPAPQNAPKFCSNCGAPLAPGAKFCSNCGAKIG